MAGGFPDMFWFRIIGGHSLPNCNMRLTDRLIIRNIPFSI
jgi:hypothetical protein